MKITDSAQVWLDDRETGPVRVGTVQALFLAGRNPISSSFEYAPSYLADPARYELSPDLPLVPGKQYFGDDTVLPGALSDAAPDDWGTSLVDASYARLRQPGQPASLGAFDHLVMLGDGARMGALRLRSDDGEWLSQETHIADDTSALTMFVAAAARFSVHEASDEDIELLGAAGSSLGGARPKVNVRLHGDRLWMLKLPSTRDRGTDGEAWEATALQLARRAGLRAPATELLRPEGMASSLLIERFDRRASSAGEHRVGYMSAMTAMRLGSQGKATYEDFADTVDRLTGSQADMHELFGRVALTVLVGNADDHWKNHGFVRGPEGWRLSPVFDVNPMRSGTRIRSRQITDRDDPTDRDIRLLLEGAEAYRLTPAEAAEALAPVVAAVQGWRGVAEANSIARSEIEHMAPAFREDQLAHALRFVELHHGHGPGKSAAARAEKLSRRRMAHPELFEDDEPEADPEPSFSL